MTWQNIYDIVCIIKNVYLYTMNKLQHDDVYTPTSHEEYKDIANRFKKAGIEVYDELLIIDEDRYEDYPHLKWDAERWSGESPNLTAICDTTDCRVLTRREFLGLAGVEPIFNNGKHLIHEFI
jgi:hypothetical protein